MDQLLLSFAQLTDSDLLAEVRRLASVERHASARLIASLSELDTRRLYLAEGCSSLFTWCTQVLHLSEYAAYSRIEAARAARRFPVILELLAAGDIHLTAIGLLAPHLTVENHRRLLESARHRTKREVEQIVANIHPESPPSASARKLPARLPPSSSDCPAPQLDVLNLPPSPCVRPATEPRAVAKPVDAERYNVQFTASRETYEKLRRAQDLLRHALPRADIGDVLDRALSALLKELERTKLGFAQKPRPSSSRPARGRHIPAAVKREVWKRDGGRCAFAGAQGRCTETSLLEFHHVVPFALGGPATTGNIELRCRAHNAYEAEGQVGASLLRERDDPA
jgi:hypothetical protein